MNINDNQPEGYLHPLYAQSFTNIGEPLFLPRCKGWLIKRQIPGTCMMPWDLTLYSFVKIGSL